MAHKISIIAILVLSSLFFYTSIAMAQDEQEVVVRGVGAIIDGNVANAKKNAISDAQRRAVEQVAGVLVEGDTEIVNELIQNDRFISQAAGFIKRYEILKERQMSGLYEVTMKALVSTRSIKTSLTALGIIITRMDFPRIIILYHPKETAIPRNAVSAEIALVKSFTEKHFDVVDPAKSRELHQEARELLKIDTVENVAARIGLKYYAEIVIIYRLGDQYIGNDGNFDKARSSIQTRVIVSTTAQILATDERSETGLGNTKEQALQKAAAGAGKAESEYLIDQILSWWDDYTNNGIPYIITIKHPAKADMLGIIFEEKVENISGVVAMTERFSGGGLLEIMVKYRGKTPLRRAILKSLMMEKGFEKMHTELSKGRFIVFSVL